MDTEALSEDEVGAGSQEGGLEVELDYSSLNPACLVPPTIPNNLGADDIDKVIAALTNVPDVSFPDLGSGDKKDRSSVSEERDRRDRDYSHERDRDRDRDLYYDYDRGKYRGRGRGRGRGFRGRGGYRGGGGGDYAVRGRGKPYIAKGRNIFPQEEERGRGRGRVRVNNLYKRFMQQHKNNGGQEDNEDDFRKSRSRSRSRSRSKGRKHRSSSSSSSSSSSDSSSSPKKKKKKKDKKHKKKKKNSAKKKRKDASSSESESESKEEAGSDWRVELLKKMKDIKNLPPDQLEVEFKKAMAEKKRKEEEEKCIQEIKNRQKMARKVKKESERAAKRAAKKEKKAKSKANSEEKDDGFYTGINMESDIRRMEEEEAKMLQQHHLEMQFKSSFAEVPFVAEGAPDDAFPGGSTAGEGQNMETEEEMDPYSKARAEQMMRERKEDGGEEVSWPAGALENTEPDYEQETREQVEAAQEEMENSINMDDKAKNVVSTSKMFSKIRKRIQGKPLKIHLKTNKLSTEEDEGIGLQPVVDSAEVAGLEPLSADDEPGSFGDFNNVGDEYDTKDSGPAGYNTQGGRVPDFYDDEEERRVAKFKERSRKRRERALEAGELEDGEHSPSPEPERPHHRRRRKRRHERREEMEEGEIGEERESRRSRHDHYDRQERLGRQDHDQNHRPVVNLPLPPPGLPFIDTSRPPPGAIHHPPPLLNPPQQRPFFPPPRPYHPPPAGPNYGQHPPPQQRHPVEMYNEARKPEMYNAYSSPKKSYFDSLPAMPRPSENLEAVDSEDDEDTFDMSKVSPIMKYIAGKLVEHKYPLQLEGPFKQKVGNTGLSKHLFVAVKIVGMLEAAGYDNSKMYMSAMFPQGMEDIKAVLMKKMTSGSLDPKIKGSRLVKMCMRCIRCFVAYYTGKAEDIASSEGECTEDEGEILDEEDNRKTKVRTVNTSLTAVLNRIKDEENETPEIPEASDPLNSVLNNGDKAR